MAGRHGELRVGTSGYQYEHWRGIVYPEALPKRRWFEYYARHFDTVEINNTFYGLPAPATFERWRDAAPSGFLYALKYSRYGTHIKRLKDPEAHLSVFVERAERLGPLLGPILVQLPPGWAPAPERLAAFLDAAPPSHRWAVEFRDARWLREEVYSILREHNAALCIHDLIDEHPWVLTADWLYLRFHGAGYAGSYSPRMLAAQAGRVAEHLRAGVDVFAYFNNDIEGYAVANARDLRAYVRERLGLDGGARRSRAG